MVRVLHSSIENNLGLFSDHDLYDPFRTVKNRHDYSIDEMNEYIYFIAGFWMKNLMNE